MQSFIIIAGIVAAAILAALMFPRTEDIPSEKLRMVYDHLDTDEEL